MTAPDPRVQRALERAAKGAVADACEYLLEQANRTAPIEEGTLIRSGSTSVQISGGVVTGVIAYDTPYAARQHEDTRLRHDAGRRSKWLERTMKERGPKVGDFMARRMDGALP